MCSFAVRIGDEVTGLPAVLPSVVGAGAESAPQHSRELGGVEVSSR